MVVWLKLVVSISALAAIFGADDRIQPRHQVARLARATALQVPLTYVSQGRDQRLNFQFSALSDRSNYNFCSGEKFAQELSSPIACSGFLVGPDLLVTAGHCAVNWTKVRDEVTPQCEAFGWLFDYQVDHAGRQPPIQGVDPAKLVYCKKVVYANFVFELRDGHTIYGEDIALIQLDRPVTDRVPIPLATAPPRSREEVAMIGYPLGIPAKVAFGRVQNHDVNFFRTDLDAVGGNSGSLVMNERGQAVGVLVRSFPDADYFEDAKAGGCVRWNVCSAELGGCLSGDRWESYTASDVQRIDALLPYLPH